MLICSWKSAGTYCLWVRPVYHTQAFIFCSGGDTGMRRDIPGTFCRYALPQMLGLLFNSVYFIVDGVFIGNRLGRDAMAAAGVAGPMLEMLIALSMAITAGSGVMVSLALAQHHTEDADQYAMHAVVTAVSAGLLLALLGNACIRPLSVFSGQHTRDSEGCYNLPVHHTFIVTVHAAELCAGRPGAQ